MQSLIAGAKRFASSIFARHQALFSKLARGQQPQVLWIGCSDSRVDPHLITQSQPGTLFVSRNPGNIVPPPELVSGEAAAIDHAVGVLGVQHIVVCGHSDCGAMRAVLQGLDDSSLPHLASWIRDAHHPSSTATDEAKLTRAIEHNVLRQLERLRAYPLIARRLDAGELALHAWVYEIGSGQIRAFDGNAFVALGSDAPTDPNP